MPWLCGFAGLPDQPGGADVLLQEGQGPVQETCPHCQNLTPPPGPTEVA